ncbi:sigma-54 dependent transcriptional regulator [Gangjinia marincola]|uniref:Sigma-54 dependent transcriptional regulator n=1 Tax=Gangjinia marincola TaxID=578463 RepID=A0ABN1MGK8_9FLAO
MQLKNARILIIDDDEDVLIALKLLLKQKVNEVVTAKNPNTILSILTKESFDVVILDMNFNGLVNTGNEGIFWLNKIKSSYPRLQVVLITAYADIDLAVRSLKLGAADFIVKPWKNDKIIEILTDLVHQKSSSNSKAVSLASTQRIVGESEPMQHIFSKLDKIAPTDANVLILGENGTGKDLIARAIHENSLRKNQSFVKVDIGSLTESLFESELFGYVKGAFTGANTDRKGRFEEAHGGTLFLDEIGNISLNQQARLLTVLQNRKVTPIGSNKAIDIDIRLICATNMPIQELADESRFRKDLIYRINTVDITIPALRIRGTDITLLAHHFVSLYAEKYNKGEYSFTPGFIKKLKEHSFPGNVRELQYTLERTIIMAEGHELTENDLSFSVIEQALPAETTKQTNLEAIEKKTILRVIDENNGNISKSAKALGITRTALYRRLNKYDL